MHNESVKINIENVREKRYENKLNTNGFSDKSIEYKNAVDVVYQTSQNLSHIGEIKKNEDNKSIDQTNNQYFELTEYLTGRISSISSTSFLPKLGVTMENFSLVSMINNSQEKKITNLFNIFSNIVKPHHNIKKYILHDITSFVLEGEMMLVLGKPGSGCTTLLKAFGNSLDEFYSSFSMDGEILYSGISAKEMKKRYKGEVIYNQEDDLHFPDLTVEQTLRFAIKTKMPRNSPLKITSKQFEDQLLKLVLDVFGLESCRHTKVGNGSKSSISGGEKKRLSIAEQISMRGTIGCWDGSTKGLDSSSALRFIKCLRIFNDLLFKTTVVSLYQASEDIFNLFDKVLLLYEGRCIYFGPRSSAKQYFLDLGFFCPDGSTTADFLTMITDKNLVLFRDDVDRDSVPKSSKDLETIFKNSNLYHDMNKKMDEYKRLVSKDYLAQQFRKDISKEKGYSYHNTFFQKLKGPYSSSWYNQLRACIRREMELHTGNKFSLYTKFFLNLIMSTTMGFIFFQTPLSSQGAFLKTGAIYSALLFSVLVLISELYKTTENKIIVNKQRSSAMYSSSAYILGQILTDFQTLSIQVFLFSGMYYFIVGLHYSFSSYFLFNLILFLISLCTTSFFRMIAWASPNVNIATYYLNVMLITTMLYLGYIIPFSDMIPWTRIIYYTNYLTYAFSALMQSQFRNIDFRCNSDELIPNGVRNQNITHQSCVLKGSSIGKYNVKGADYIDKAFDIKDSTTSSLSFNIFMLLCFWAVFVLLTIVLMNFSFFTKKGQIKKEFKHKKSNSNKIENHESVQISTSKKDTFWFRNISYFVNKNGKEIKLLDNINGTIKPGSLFALMGASGAGKSTLLNYLCFRNNSGIRKGDVYLGNKIFSKQNSKSIGYCQQTDVHDPASTVKEALKFSAYLRQKNMKNRTEIDLHVDGIIKMLEMEDIADALIGSPDSGVGISLEERKKLSIGIELVADPQILFLDEPTSGLDSHASLVIIRFLKKLSDSGKSIICTIHQPSPVLFNYFTDLILLKKGGKLIYFGESKRGQQVLEHFKENGLPGPKENENIAEYILNISQIDDENLIEVWRNSKYKKEIDTNIQNLMISTRNNNNFNIKQSPRLSQIKKIKIVLSRIFRSYWRSPSYNISRFLNQLFVSFILGITFYKLGNNLNAFQNRVFLAYQVVVLGVLNIIGVQPQYMNQKSLFEREYKSGFYGSGMFFMAITIVEIFYTIISSSFFFIVFYFLVGFSLELTKTVYFYLMYVFFSLYTISLGQLLVSVIESLNILPSVNSILTLNMALLSGVSVPYKSIPKLFKFLYWLNPYHYAVEGIVTNEIDKLSIKCSEKELLYFMLPPNTASCLDYASSFIENALGYLVDTGTSKCGYCPYKDGMSYLNTLSWSPSRKWNNLYLVICFWSFNILCIGMWIHFRYKR